MDLKNIIFVCGISGIGKTFITRQIRDMFFDKIDKVNIDALFLDQKKEEIILLFYKNFYLKFDFLEKSSSDIFIKRYLDIFNNDAGFDTPKTLYLILKQYSQIDDKDLDIREKIIDDIYKDIIAPSFSELIINYFKEKSIIKDNILVDIGFRNMFCLNSKITEFFQKNGFKINIVLLQPTIKIIIDNLNKVTNGIMEILHRNSCIEYIKDFVNDESCPVEKSLKIIILDALDTKKYTKEEVTKKLVNNKQILEAINKIAAKYFAAKINLLNKYFLSLQTLKGIKFTKLIISKREDISKLTELTKNIIFAKQKTSKEFFY